MAERSEYAEAPLIARLIRTIARILPHQRGRFRALGICHRLLKRKKNLPDKVIATMRDGRLMEVDLNSYGQAEHYWLGEAETVHRTEGVLRACLCPGDVCVDAGANVGLITTAMARIVGPSGHVYSFEPVRQAFEALERNVRLNGFLNVSLVNSALGSSNDRVTLYVDPRRLEISSIGIPQKLLRTGAFSQEECACVTLDEFVRGEQISRVCFLKIDVEGLELAVLNGARRILGEHLPLIWVELSVVTAARLQYHPSEILRLLQQDFGYEAYRMGVFGLVRMTHVGFRRQNRNVLMMPPGGLDCSR